MALVIAVSIALVAFLLTKGAAGAAGTGSAGATAPTDSTDSAGAMPPVALTDAECVPARGAMLMSLAGCMTYKPKAGVLYFEVLEPRYATRRDGELAVCRDPDPNSRFVLGAGSDVRYALTAAVVHRGRLVPGYVVAVRSRGGYARVDKASGACAVSENVASDACLWVVARDATGGVFDATRALLRGVAPFVATPAGPQVQPNSIPSSGSGTTLASAGCALVRAGQAACDAGGECVFCDTLAPAMCENAATFGACAVYGAVCPVQCAISGAPGALEVRVTDPRAARATFVARQPMFMASAAQKTDVREPSMAALSAAIRTKRWMLPAMDASVSAEKLSPSDRAYFWSVLRAMTARRMPYDVGSAWSESVHGGWAPSVGDFSKIRSWRRMQWRPARASSARVSTNRDAEWATADAASECRRHLVASSARSGTADRARYLNYARMIGECETPAMARAWYDETNSPGARSPAMTVALGTTLRRFGVGARIARTRDAGLTAEQRVSAVRALGVSEKAARRVAAFESGEYAGFAWADVQEMFGLTDEEVGILKTALSPLSFTIGTRAVEWTAMKPWQKIALVEQWNAGCTFHFASGALQMPRGCGARVGAQSYFPATFRYGFWPSDLATREGRTTKHGGSYRCVRCPAGGTKPVVEEEHVACKLKEAYEGWEGLYLTAERYDANRRGGLAPWEVCDGETHPEWSGGASYPHRLESGEGDGTSYEDGPDEYFVHYARLDDALTNFTDGARVRRRDKVRVCTPCPSVHGWWTPDHAACVGAACSKACSERGVFDLGAGNFAFAPYEPYLSEGPPGNPFKTGTARNTELGSVTIAPGFAVYVTPHYHGFHASQRTCHHGLRRMRSEPDVSGSGKKVHVEQCRVGSWTPQKVHDGAFVDVEAEPLGLVLVNDDLASAWVVARGDAFAAVAIDTSGTGSAEAVRDHVFPSLVNCLAAWNYCAFPSHWLQRAHTDPASGDKVPELDVVAGPGENNVGATTDGVADFIAHNAKLGALTVFRTQRIFDPPKLEPKN